MCGKLVLLVAFSCRQLGGMLFYIGTLAIVHDKNSCDEKIMKYCRAIFVRDNQYTTDLVSNISRPYRNKVAIIRFDLTH
jgi:hypothetical protein